MAGLHQPTVQFGHPLAHQIDIAAAAQRATANDHGAIVKKPLGQRPGVTPPAFHPRIQMKRQPHQNESLQHHPIKVIINYDSKIF